MGQPGNAVGHEPDGEQQGQYPLPRARIEQEHAAAHHAEDAGNQGDCGGEAGVLFQSDKGQDIIDARDECNQPVNGHNSGEQAAGAQKGEHPEQD